MQLQETILTSSSSGSTLNIHDMNTGTTLCSFKGFPSSSFSSGVNSITHLESTSTLGGYILGTNSEKGVLGVWNFQKEVIQIKIVLPTKLTCLAIDPKGDWCVGGTKEGQLYLWEVASGILWNLWDAHYRAVTVLRFTRDGNAIISGSDDSGVCVWMMSSLLAVEPNNTHPTPISTFSDHTLPITDIQCGIGAYPKCRILTSSMDCSVKLWDISPKSSSSSSSSSTHLLTTFLFPTPIRCICWDIAERFFYASSQTSSSSPSSGDNNGSSNQQQPGGGGGAVYRMNLYATKVLEDGKRGGNTREAVGGMGSLDIIRFAITSEGGNSNNETQSGTSKTMPFSGEMPTTMALSITGALLLVGTSKGMVHVYDVGSGQRLRSFTAAKDASISTLSTLVKPLDLIGHVVLSSSTTTLYPTGSGSGTALPPLKPILPFQRVLANMQRLGSGVGVVGGTQLNGTNHGSGGHEISVILPLPPWLNNVGKEDYQFICGSGGDGGVGNEFQTEHRFFVGSSTGKDFSTSQQNDNNHSQNQNGGGSQAAAAAKEERIRVLEQDVEKLTRQLEKAKGINDKMWEGVVGGAVYGKKDGMDGMQ